MFSFSTKIKNSLTRTRSSVFGQITGLFEANQIDDELWDDLEALLIQAYVGVETTLELINCTFSGNSAMNGYSLATLASVSPE